MVLGVITETGKTTRTAETCNLAHWSSAYLHLIITKVSVIVSNCSSQESATRPVRVPASITSPCLEHVFPKLPDVRSGNDEPEGERRDPIDRIRVTNAVRALYPRAPIALDLLGSFSTWMGMSMNHLVGGRAFTLVGRTRKGGRLSSSRGRG